MMERLVNKTIAHEQKPLRDAVRDSNQSSLFDRTLRKPMLALATATILTAGLVAGGVKPWTLADAQARSADDYCVATSTPQGIQAGVFTDCGSFAMELVGGTVNTSAILEYGTQYNASAGTIANPVVSSFPINQIVSLFPGITIQFVNIFNNSQGNGEAQYLLNDSNGSGATSTGTTTTGTTSTGGTTTVVDTTTVTTPGTTSPGATTTTASSGSGGGQSSGTTIYITTINNNTTTVYTSTNADSDKSGKSSSRSSSSTTTVSASTTGGKKVSKSASTTPPVVGAAAPTTGASATGAHKPKTPAKVQLPDGITMKIVLNRGLSYKNSGKGAAYINEPADVLVVAGKKGTKLTAAGHSGSQLLIDLDPLKETIHKGRLGKGSQSVQISYTGNQISKKDRLGVSVTGYEAGSKKPKTEDVRFTSGKQRLALPVHLEEITGVRVGWGLQHGLSITVRNGSKTIATLTSVAPEVVYRQGKARYDRTADAETTKAHLSPGKEIYALKAESGNRFSFAGQQMGPVPQKLENESNPLYRLVQKVAAVAKTAKPKSKEEHKPAKEEDHKKAGLLEAVRG